ncbi:MAG: molybdenum-binding transcriptional regulator [Paracoccus denitrificans]|nr:MAG: molybdenum-binding transcriptional regulator [Paracoccus denitrificans]PZO83045.1 MAG: molybdenum-binding transcriptional regulator [Paracoccus denitrificans]
MEAGRVGGGGSGQSAVTDGFPRLKVQLHLADGQWLGPGKAEMLALIAETGSISAAGRRMKMSYKRAWSMVEGLNAMFPEPLVDSARGGPQGGGASLTGTGRRVLEQFQALQAAVEAAAAPIVATLSDMSARK